MFRLEDLKATFKGTNVKNQIGVYRLHSKLDDNLYAPAGLRAPQGANSTCVDHVQMSYVEGRQLRDVQLSEVQAKDFRNFEPDFPCQ